MPQAQAMHPLGTYSFVSRKAALGRITHGSYSAIVSFSFTYSPFGHPVCIYLEKVLSCVLRLNTSREGTADAKIEVQYVSNSELIKSAWRESVYSLACFVYCRKLDLIPAFT